MGLTLTKHHGLGNDFLVIFDDQPLPEIPHSELAWRLCDRRRGIGADGLIVAVINPGTGADLGMILRNADGSAAEMSGNGIRCLAQAWASRAGVRSGAVRIDTGAGRRVVDVQPGPSAVTVLASVALGDPVSIEAPRQWDALGCDPGRPVAHLSLGNPHAVVAVDDVHDVDLAALGRLVPDVNLEIVAAGPERGAVTMRVHERGAGITEACGTGAGAAAYAADRWGLVDAVNDEITVHMAGGDAKVRVHPELVLIGPATYIGHIEVPD
jgi:diaminopimelate epimerase